MWNVLSQSMIECEQAARAGLRMQAMDRSGLCGASRRARARIDKVITHWSRSWQRRQALANSPFASARVGANMRPRFVAQKISTTAAEDELHPSEPRLNAVAPLRVESQIAETRRELTLRDCIARAVQRHLGEGARAADLYRLVLAEVELPLLSEVLA